MWVAEWNEVLFTDESRICLQHHDVRIRVWNREERMLNSCVMYRHTGPAPGIMPIERQRIRRTRKELEEMNCEDESTDIWKENWFYKYEKRPEEMDEITLAKFVAHYTPMNVNEYKREMGTLHFPFRNEELLAYMKFIQHYDDTSAEPPGFHPGHQD
ncbi:helitron_like_N domain-containing protein [Trichonephila clavipes]|nr:helitron_like_N domain-containing protein [Trichonephila clavipes]